MPRAALVSRRHSTGRSQTAAAGLGGRRQQGQAPPNSLFAGSRATGDAPDRQTYRLQRPHNCQLTRCRRRPSRADATHVELEEVASPAKCAALKDFAPRRRLKRRLCTAFRLDLRSCWPRYSSRTWAAAYQMASASQAARVADLSRGASSKAHAPAKRENRDVAIVTRRRSCPQGPRRVRPGE